MKVVVDANRVYSAVLRDGTTRRILFSTAAELFAPALLRKEIVRHAPELARRSGLAPVDLRKLLDKVFSEILWVDEPALLPHLAKAEKALARRDPTDVPYLAAALAIEADAIWSHDPDFDEQDLVDRIENHELV